MEKYRISSRIHTIRPSLTLALKTCVNERREQGLPVYDFGLGETKGALAPYIREAAERAYRDGHTMYGDPAGLPEVRQAVLDWLALNDHYSVDDVVISSGAKQSLFNVFLATCNPSDCVLLDAAPWVSYQPLAVAANAFAVMVLPQAGEASYLKISGDDLRRNLSMRPEAKLFLLNNPCNPTAQLYSAEEVDELLSICVEFQVYFVLDRLYWKLLFEHSAYPEPRIDDETKPWLIQVDGLSKNFRRTGGLRIGWAIAPRDLALSMTNLQSHYTAGPALPAQHAALGAITHPYDWGLRDELRQKRDLLQREARALPGVRVWPTPATFYSFWEVRDHFGKKTPSGEVISSSTDLAEYLVRAAGVVTASGQAFLQDGFLRVSFAVPDEEIVDGVRAAAEALAALR